MRRFITFLAGSMFSVLVMLGAMSGGAYMAMIGMFGLLGSVLVLVHARGGANVLLVTAIVALVGALANEGFAHIPVIAMYVILMLMASGIAQREERQRRMDAYYRQELKR
jgi:hypothetical protein